MHVLSNFIDHSNDHSFEFFLLVIMHFTIGVHYCGISDVQKSHVALGIFFFALVKIFYTLAFTHLSPSSWWVGNFYLFLFVYLLWQCCSLNSRPHDC
jgi:hypothetical protein